MWSSESVLVPGQSSPFPFSTPDIWYRRKISPKSRHCNVNTYLWKVCIHQLLLEAVISHMSWQYMYFASIRVFGSLLIYLFGIIGDMNYPEQIYIFMFKPKMYPKRLTCMNWYAVHIQKSVRITFDIFVRDNSWHELSRTNIYFCVETEIWPQNADMYELIWCLYTKVGSDRFWYICSG